MARSNGRLEFGGGDIFDLDLPKIGQGAMNSMITLLIYSGTIDPVYSSILYRPHV